MAAFRMMEALLIVSILADKGLAVSLVKVGALKTLGDSVNLLEKTDAGVETGVGEKTQWWPHFFWQTKAQEDAQEEAQEGEDEDDDMEFGSTRRRKVAARGDVEQAWNDQGFNAPNKAPVLGSDYGMKYVNYSLCNVSVHSNLAGVGPDIGGEHSIRYYNIATAGKGQGIDLVITANSTYIARDININGLVSEDSCFGAVNLKSTRSDNLVDLLFTFYLTGTNTTVALEKFYMTIYDFDSSSTATEHATFYRRVKELYYVEDHEMAISGNLTSEIGLTFSSKEQGTGSDNPQDPLELTPEQQKRAVMVSYERRSQFKISFSVVGGKSGRNFAFAGFSNLRYAAGTTTTERFAQKTTTQPSKPTKPPTTTAKAGEPTTTTTTTCYTQSCAVWADPHVSGFDNDGMQGPAYLALLGGTGSGMMANQAGVHGADVGVHAGKSGIHTFDKRPVDVDAYDAGDFWLVKSEPVHIQARFRLSGEFVPDRAAIGAVAVGGPFLNGQKLLVEPLDGNVMFDGMSLPRTGTWSDEASEVTVSQTGSDVEVSLPMSVAMTFRRFAKHIDVKITMPQIPGGVDGECGNFDGIAENDEEASVIGRMGDVRIDDGMLLFDTKFDPAE